MGHGLRFAWIGETQTYFNSHSPMVLAEVASVWQKWHRCLMSYCCWIIC
jgi:oligoendopeptidase F